MGREEVMNASANGSSAAHAAPSDRAGSPISGPVLVYGATGAQGGAIARRFLSYGWRVRVMARDADKATPLALAGAEVVQGDLDDAASLAAAHAGVGGVVFTLPLIYDRQTALRWGRNAFQAATDAGVGRLVFNASLRLPQATTDVAAYEIKRDLLADLRASELPHVSLWPPAYLDNLAAPWTWPSIIEQGVLAYPVAETTPISWLALDDLAAIAEAVLRRPELNGEVIPIGGPEALTGPELAERVSRGIGRAVRYEAIPPEAFAAQLAPMLGDDAAREIGKLYASYTTAGPTAPDMTLSDPASLVDRLGIHLTSVEQWARSVAAMQRAPV